MIKPYLFYYRCPVCVRRFAASRLAMIRNSLACPECGLSREKMELEVIHDNPAAILAGLSLSIAGIDHRLTLKLRKLSASLEEILKPFRNGAAKQYRTFVLPALRMCRTLLRFLFRIISLPFRLLWRGTKKAARFASDALKYLIALIRKLFLPLQPAFKAMRTIFRKIGAYIDRLLQESPGKRNAVVLPRWANSCLTWMSKIFWSALFLLIWSILVEERAYFAAIVTGLGGIVMYVLFFGKKPQSPPSFRRDEIRTEPFSPEFLQPQSPKWLRELLWKRGPLLFYCTACASFFDIAEASRMPENFIKSTTPLQFFFCPRCRRELGQIPPLEKERHSSLYSEYERTKKKWNILRMLQPALLTCACIGIWWIMVLQAAPLPAALISYIFFTGSVISMTYIPRAVTQTVHHAPGRE